MKAIIDEEHRKLAAEMLAEERLKIVTAEARRDALHKVGNRKKRRKLAAQLRTAKL